jgi:Ca2+-binding RTX toxin-like protein
MAILTIIDPSLLDATLGPEVVTGSSATKISVNFPTSGYSFDMLGSFTYSSGELTGGRITGLNYLKNGQLVVSISEINVNLVDYVNAATPDIANNLIYGGNDQYFGSPYAEVLYGRNGNDTIIALDGDDVVYGGPGADDANGNVGQDVVHGDEGPDIVRGGKGADTIYGDAGDDPHVNGNIGNDIVYGGLGNDTVYGGQDQDTLYGDAGVDLLSGDLGNDVLYGGAGGDHFVLRAGGGIDWVADFKAAEGDRILLTPGTAYTVLNSSGQALIDIGGGTQIGLAGVAVASFSADWVIFG